MTTVHDSSADVCRAVLVLPHLRVQNANAISSPLTWGFPAVSAFTGMSTALERRLGNDSGASIYGVGIVCHDHEAQVTEGGYTRAFRLTRNPILPDGSTAGIVEEGRIHLELTLVLDLEIDVRLAVDSERSALAERVAHELAGMRVAGGSVMPALPTARRRPVPSTLELISGAPEEQRQQFRRMARRWLPGFALVARDDLLQSHLRSLRAVSPEVTALDAWLDLSRWNARAAQRAATKEGEPPGTLWETDARPGWIVPMPVGFAALSELHAAGTVAGARDRCTPFRFVESVWSIGQWISPLRLRRFDDLFWTAHHDAETGLYRCRNGYAPNFISADSASQD